MARRRAIICCSPRIAFWPAILFVLPGIGLAIAAAHEPAIRFLLAWAGGWWLVVRGGAHQAAALCAARLSGAGDPGGAVAAGAQRRGAADLARLARRLLPCIAALQFLIGLAALSAAPVWLPQLYGDGLRDAAADRLCRWWAG